MGGPLLARQRSCSLDDEIIKRDTFRNGDEIAKMGGRNFGVSIEGSIDFPVSDRFA
jgi:hypothetical protein